MERVTMEKLSDDLCVSKTTVSKALNHCAGIRYETKKKILKAAQECGYDIKKTSAQIGIVLPGIPGYFWKTAAKELEKAGQDLTRKCNTFIYSDLRQETDAEICIDRAAESGISVMIAAVPDTQRIRSKLQKLAKHILILLFEEYLEVQNTFFVGEDDYRSGYELGRRYLETYPETKRILIVKQHQGQGAVKRIDGFTAALAEFGLQPCATVELFGKDHALAAVIARELAQVKSEFECVFCQSGTVPYVCQAIGKLKLKRQIHCIGFENPNTNRLYFETGMLKMVMEQNLKMQAETAMQIANQYICEHTVPASQCIRIKPKLVEAI